MLPSNVGGAHWGGVAVDTARQIAVVPVNHLVAIVQLIPLDRFDTLEARQNASRLDDQYTRMHGTPYVMRRRIVKSPTGIPCAPTPWGSFVAINLKTGAKLWDVPLGDPANLKPEVSRLPHPPTGLPNLGGPIVTAGGIAFIGAATRSLHSRVRYRDRQRAVARAASRRSPCDADDLCDRRTTVRRDRGRRKRRLGSGRLLRRVQSAERVKRDLSWRRASYASIRETAPCRPVH